MIPRRIRLRNFLSYRDCTVDLTGLHLAVLSGKNGDGKSALLDAMTWAVWGEARGRLEDDRIHLAEQEAMVDFEFEIAGDVFQVVRKRTRGRGGSVEFFQVGDGGLKTALTGGTSSETESAIVRRVRMDYDTFANSAFVAQGRADEFTRKPPSERKEVFRKVLGLERYELLSKRADDQRKDAARRLRDIDTGLDQAREEVGKLPAVVAELETAVVERAALQAPLGAAEGQAAELRHAASDYERLDREATDAARRVEETLAAIAKCEKTVRELEGEMEAVARALAEKERTQASYARLKALRDEEQELAIRQVEAQRQRDAMAAAERSIGEERARLEAQTEALGRDIERAEQAATGLAEIRTLEERLGTERTALVELEGAVEVERTTEQELRQSTAGLKSDAAQFKTQAQELKDREDQLQEGLAACPVCRQPLSPDQLEHVRGEYSAQRKSLGERYHKALGAAAEAEDGANRRQVAVVKMQADLTARRAALQARERDIHAQMKTASDAEAQLPHRRELLREAEDVLRSEGFAAEARERLMAAREALERSGYDGERHATVRAELGELAGVEQAYVALTRAEERQTALDRSIARERQEIAERQAALSGEEASLLAAQAALEAAEDVAPRLAAAEAQLADLRERDSALAIRQGRAEQQKEHLAGLAARIEVALDQSKALREEEQLFGDLAKAFGRDGVQAMLIDQSLPRLQETANAMLDRMTGGRIQLSLHTQRENARGGMVETLDVRISDDLGTRDYEMYSGGEAFRVDFALRIALARLLAETAGADLPTLIIDEGFGSQDQEGIDRLLEAINAISDEFRLILVVTHIDEMRERFERRIEVTKDPERGSFARVV
jgi:exonuclease SbcC